MAIAGGRLGRITGLVLGLALMLATSSLGAAAERARLDAVAALTVVFELLSDWPEAVAAPEVGVFAVYGPDAELRQSGDFVPDHPFVVTARPGDRLSFAVRVGDSDDLLIQAAAPGIALFTAAGRPATGNVTGRVDLLDAAGEPVRAAAYPPLERLVRVTVH